MMDFDKLCELIQGTTWFINLGLFQPEDRTIALRDLSPWAKPHENELGEAEKVAGQMDWLPSSQDQIDPINGRALEELIKIAGVELLAKEKATEIYKLTLVSLRRFSENPLLKSGPHDFTDAAKGAALFATRRAVAEIAADSVGFWCRLIQIYAEGNWPCGILPDNTVVVF